MNTVTDRIALTDAEIEACFKKLGYGVSAEDLTVTTETLADFRSARSSWAVKGVEKARENALVFEDCQTMKGQPRRDVAVIDFGAVRLVAAL